MATGHQAAGHAVPSTVSPSGTPGRRLASGWRVEETTDLATVDPQEWDRLVTASGAGFYLGHAWLSALHAVDGFAERTCCCGTPRDTWWPA